MFSECGHDVTVSVATEYGKDFIPENPSLKVTVGRLTLEEMTSLLKNGFDYAVDATHPYADIATQNIESACTATNTLYLRLTRGKSCRDSSVIYVDTVPDAVKILQNTKGNILLTIGVKELEGFTAIDGYASRMFVRILPMVTSLENVLKLGFKNSNIICMQGPFGIEINTAILKMTHAEWIVTKDSGSEGGFHEKLAAAQQVGCGVIVLARPNSEKRNTYEYTFDEILDFFRIPNYPREFTYFPLFINMKNKKILVVGGGNVAERRIKALLTAGADITLVSESVKYELNNLIQSGAIKYADRRYKSGDAEGAFLVIAATDDREVNRLVLKDATEAGALVIISDNRDECGCYFPAIAENREFLAGIVSKTGNHSRLKEKAQELRDFLKKDKL